MENATAGGLACAAGADAGACAGAAGASLRPGRHASQDQRQGNRKVIEECSFEYTVSPHLLMYGPTRETNCFIGLPLLLLTRPSNTRALNQ